MKKQHSQFMHNQISFDFARKMKIMPKKIKTKIGIQFLMKNGDLSPVFSHAYTFSNGFTCGVLLGSNKKVYMDMVGNVSSKPTQKGTDLYKYAQRVEKYGVQAIEELDAKYFLDEKFCQYIIWRYVASAKVRMQFLLAKGEAVNKDLIESYLPAYEICNKKRTEAKLINEEIDDEKN